MCFFKALQLVSPRIYADSGIDLLFRMAASNDENSQNHADIAAIEY
jgi:hypothetical protein